MGGHFFSFGVMKKKREIRSCFCMCMMIRGSGLYKYKVGIFTMSMFFNHVSNYSTVAVSSGYGTAVCGCLKFATFLADFWLNIPIFRFVKNQLLVLMKD